jgi:sugar phosphate permease
MIVQIGFVVGTLISAFLTLADRMEARLLFAVSSLAGAAANALLLGAGGPSTALPLRFLTGAFLAGVYPPAMKLASSWFRQGRGLAVGALIGALTLGSAAPHSFGVLAFFDTAGEIPWQWTVAGASALAVIGGLLVLVGCEEGPYGQRAPRFDPKAAKEILMQRGVRLANLGYLGHMWELYAMWTWVPAFLLELFETRHGAVGAPAAAAASFAVIAAGGPGSLAAGYLADRLGRTIVVMASLVVSGACCLLAGRLAEVSLTAVVILCLVWGFAVVADSAQFSTMVTELAPRRLVGTALTLQTSLGFLLTTISMRALPWIRENLGWNEAFSMLALGPVAGIVAMVRLRRSPESAAIASGRK